MQGFPACAKGLVRELSSVLAGQVPNMETMIFDLKINDFYHSSASMDLIKNIGHQSFVESLKQVYSSLIKYSHISILYFRERSNPILIGTDSATSKEVANHIAFKYLDKYYSADPVFSYKEKLQANHDLIHIQRQKAEEIKNSNYRYYCYDDAGVKERLSLVQLLCDGGFISINLYKNNDQHFFDQIDVSRIVSVSPFVFSTLSKHIEFKEIIERRSRDTQFYDARQKLSGREYEVFSRILNGLTVKEIAKELGIAPTSVAEHRKNAYSKLSIKNYKQLLSMLNTSHQGSRY